MDSIFGNLGEHLSIFFAGASALALIGHAVNTFPTPENPYGKWLLGTVQFAVGQRLQSQATKAAPEIAKGVSA